MSVVKQLYLQNLSVSEKDRLIKDNGLIGPFLPYKGLSIKDLGGIPSTDYPLSQDQKSVNGIKGEKDNIFYYEAIKVFEYGIINENIDYIKMAKEQMDDEKKIKLVKEDFIDLLRTRYFVSEEQFERLGPLYEEAFSIIKERPEMGFNQTTSLFGRSLVVRALSNKYVLNVLLQAYGEEVIGNQLFNTRIGAKKQCYVDFLISEKLEEANLGLALENLSQQSPKIYNQLKDYLVNKGQWDCSNRKDLRVIHFMSGYYELENEMRDDLKESEAPSKRKKSLKF